MTDWSQSVARFDRKTGKDLELDNSVRNAMMKDGHSYSYLPELCIAAGNATSTFLFGLSSKLKYIKKGFLIIRPPFNK